MHLTEKQLKKVHKIAKVVDEGNLAIAQMILELEDKIDEQIPSLNAVIERMKGDKGDSPTEEEIIALIKPLIPQVENGKTPTREELLSIIKPLIPQVKDGITPSKQQILDLIKPLIPKIDTSSIALEASKMAQDALKYFIPTIESIESDLPKLGDKIRDGLELLPEGEKLKIEAVENLRKELDEIKKKGGEHIVSTSNRGLYQLLDVNISGITNGQSIKWNGTQWIPYNPASSEDLVNYVPYIGATQDVDLNNKQLNNVNLLSILGGYSISQSESPNSPTDTLSNIPVDPTSVTGTYQNVTINSQTDFPGTASNFSTSFQNLSAGTVSGDYEDAVVGTYSFYDDGLGTLFSNYDSHVVATIDYSTGAVTNVSGEIIDDISYTYTAVTTENFTDNGNGALISSLDSTQLGTIDYTSGSVDTTGFNSFNILTINYNQILSGTTIDSLGIRTAGNIVGNSFRKINGLSSQFLKADGSIDSTAYLSGLINLGSQVTGTLPVNHGGTGATSFTAGRILFGNGTSAINTSANLFWDNSNSRLGIGTASPGSQLQITSTNASNKGLIVKGATSQSGNYFEIQNSAGTALLKYTSGGNLVGNSDNSFFAWDAGSERFGIVKKSGSVGNFAYVSGQALAFVRASSTSTIDPLAVGQSYSQMFALSGDTYTSPGANAFIALPLHTNSSGQSATLPSITHSGENTTGMFFPGGRVGFTVSGTEIGSFNGTGLGIGAAASHGALDVNVGTNKYVNIRAAVAGGGGVPAGLTNLGAVLELSRPSDGAQGILGWFVVNNNDAGMRARSNFIFYNNTTETMRLTDAGNLGIGTASPNSLLQVNGSFSLPYVAKTADYTLTASDYTVDCTTNTFTITLPTAVGIQGRIYNIKNSGTGVITVDANGSETIDGQLTQTILTGNNMEIQSTNAGWIIL